VSIETLDLLRSGQLAGKKRLALACGLTQFPTEILDLADSLEILDLSNNHLNHLPDDFQKLKNLKAAFFINNAFEELPEVLAQCPQLNIIGFKSNQIQHISDQALSSTLRWLILTNNRIDQLPSKIGNLNKLQKLMLAGNHLQSLPDDMAGCHNLELIRLSANQLTSLPSWLFTLPRLAWLAYSGNPLCAAIPTVKREIVNIDWEDLSLGNTLGEGASGVISKGTWQKTATQAKAVAIKVFKGKITSDGLPEEEIQTCIAAGTHPNLVNVLGKVVKHPEQKIGLVLSLIPPEYKNLGGPPNLETCTRDTYPPDTAFSVESTLRIAQGIAGVAAHLHRQGILHGDLYAHNILVNDTGDSLLGDFGAASFYDLTDTIASQAFEQIEVRAFGCLLEDLLKHCLKHCNAEPGRSQQAVIDQLLRIQQNCMSPIPSQRPLFADICNRLARIESLI
jgi:Protein tyrosine and serine/threonine kinase/Leucine rich repeat/Leucine Rich Repeat